MGAEVDRSKLPIPDPAFTGTIKRTLEGSVPDWDIVDPIEPPDGAPNVLLVLIDDAGFGNPSTFGGPINTPNFTRMAEGGLTYNRFHVTALCSPTRAELLTGRNHHAVGFGAVTETSAGFPGYDALLPQHSAGLPKILQGNGYSTAAIGKWHLTPDHQQGPAGPFSRWPNAWGFDYFWGFLGGESGQYDPLIAQDNSIIGVPEGDDYYLPDDMTDKAISWLHRMRAQDADKPFFLYYSTGCSHAPHQVPPQWSDKYAGKFDGGWDKYREETFARQKELGVIPPDTELTPSPMNPGGSGPDDRAFPPWDSLGRDDKRLYARQMEVFAGYQENADWNVGRLLDAIDGMGELDDTLVIWIWGDNGASMEGTLTGTFNELTTENGVPLTAEQQRELVATHGGLPAWGTERLLPHYSAAWAWAGNCPFQWGKQVASHLGGTRDAMVVHWPARISEPGLRSQFTHSTDITPTILDIAGIPAPTSVDGVDQQAMHGFTFADSFVNANAPEHHTQQHFEIYGNRAMYKDGWWLSTMLPRIPWDASPTTMAQFAPGVWHPDTDPVELYYLPDDFSQAHDLAAANPAKVQELRELFWVEAEKYEVLPLLAAFGFYWGVVPPPSTQTTFPYFGDVENVASGMIPPIYAHSYTISADLVVPEGGAEGVIVAEANDLGGFSLFVQDGMLKHTYSMLGVKVYRQEATSPLPTGDVKVRLEFVADAPGTLGTGGMVTLFVNDAEVGSGQIDNTVPHRFSAYAGMDIGRDNGAVVERSYGREAPFAFTGTVEQVVFDVIPLATPEAQMAAHQEALQGRVAAGLSA